MKNEYLKYFIRENIELITNDLFKFTEDKNLSETYSKKKDLYKKSILNILNTDNTSLKSLTPQENNFYLQKDNQKQILIVILNGVLDENYLKKDNAIENINFLKNFILNSENFIKDFEKTKSVKKIKSI